MSKGSGPAPNFMGLADKMGAWNLGANQQQTLANRPNQYTPWGSTTWSQAPGGWNGPPTSTVGVSPIGGGDGSSGSPGGGQDGSGGTGGYGGQGDGGSPYGERGIVGPGGPPPPGGFSSGPEDAAALAGMNGQGANPWGIGGGSELSPAAGSGGAAPFGLGAPAFQGGPQSNIVQRGPSGPPPPGGGPSWTPPPWQGDPNPTPPPGGWGQSGPGGHPGNPNFGGGSGGGGGAPPYNPSAGVTAMPGQWSQTTTLNPELQAAADAQMKLQNQRSGFGLQQFGQLSDAMKNPFSLGGLPGGGQALDPNSMEWNQGQGEMGRNRAEDALYGRSTSRLDPQWGQQEEQLRTRLANQGLDPTSEAFQKEMGNFGRSKNDAYSQAMQNAIAGGGQEQALQFGMGLQNRQQQLGAQAQGYGQAEQSRGRTLSELLQQRELPINEMNALMNGQNVQTPQFGPFMGAGAAQSPNYLGAGQAQGAYNQNQQQLDNAIFGDIGQGAGTFAKFLPFLFGSDERIKQNIRRLPVEVLPGVPLVLFEYKHAPGKTEIGVIAQDVEKVRPRAVVKDRNGIRYVNYADLGED